MTPGARAAAAIACLDEIAAGAPAEVVLTRWGRGARYAGSGDRAAVRDMVYDVLRRWRSTAARGGGETGRARLIGLLRQDGQDPDRLFDGTGHAPPPLSEAERSAGREPTGAEALDWPDWLVGEAGDGWEEIAEALRHRAPVHVRVNEARTTRADLRATLAREGIVARDHPEVTSALELTDGARKFRNSAAFRDGLAELQDAQSQALAHAVPIWPGATVLDYCAGGGGKALALAARAPSARITAHDIDARRMADLPPRAARAGALIDVAPPGGDLGPHDVVLCDAPCSGSGSWRRDPEGKWRLTPARLAELCDLQVEILATAAGLARTHLVYATCSVLPAENEGTVSRALARLPGWHLAETRTWRPGPLGDGFFLARFEKD